MSRKRKKQSSDKLKMVSFGSIKSPQAEAFRTLRTNLQFAGFNKDIKTILITSSIPKEGKTTVAVNLALALAQTDEKQVLLIDANYRNPSINQIFSIHNDKGLTNLLLKQPEPMEKLFHRSVQDNLTLITSGPLIPNPADMFAGRQMNEAFDFLSEHFDQIIIDSPPVLQAADALVLGAQADGTLLVVNCGRTDRDDCINARDQLKRVNANLLGVVLNNVSAGNSIDFISGNYEVDHSDVAARI